MPNTFWWLLNFERYVYVYLSFRCIFLICSCHLNNHPSILWTILYPSPDDGYYNRNVNVDFTSWYIHLFGLYFSCYLHIYIYIYMICKQLFLRMFLKWASGHSFHTVKWFQVLLCITNNSIKHQSFVYSLLNYRTVLFLTIQFYISHSFKCQTVLFWSIIRTVLGVRVDVRSMRIKGYSTSSKIPGLEPRHPIVFMTLFGGWSYPLGKACPILLANSRPRDFLS